MKKWIIGARVRTLPAAIAPVLVGTVYANSINCINAALALIVSLFLQIAVNYANENGIFTVAIVGFDGGKVSKTAKLVIHAKTNQGDYGPAEDVHLVINHAVASLIREKLYRK